MGIPVIENQRFSVSKFQIFKVSKSFTKFHNVNITKSSFSKFLEHTFPEFPSCEFLRFLKFNIFENELGFCLGIFRSLLVSPKSRIIGFGSHGHVHQVRKP